MFDPYRRSEHKEHELQERLDHYLEQEWLGDMGEDEIKLIMED